MSSLRPFTKSQFERMNLFAKGYWVYMAGADPDEPNIPESWAPPKHYRKRYEAGQQHAILICQDDP